LSPLAGSAADGRLMNEAVLPRTAILIPAYNAAATIAETLSSLQKQGASLSRLAAVYVADDGSTDDTVGIAKRTWRSEVPLVAYECPDNLGERANVNRALGQFGRHMDWVCLLHADDLAKPNWLAHTLEVIASSGQDVASVCCSWDNLWPDGRVAVGEDDPGRPVQHIAGSPARVRETLLLGCWWHISGCAIRMRAFDEVGPFDASLPQLGDWDWLLRCLAGGWVVAYIPRALIVYRQTPGGVGSVSFQTDRDIREGLYVIRKYRSVLSRGDIARLHTTRAAFALRRAARGAMQWRWRRVAVALGTAGQAIASGASQVLRPRGRGAATGG
jgi:glycosyltransferase involved in cell wall biosynthesis